ncbi:MAG TPA: antibiotic biosynthesis monooxygenase [Vicinamibacterales bacterium]|jgi:heme-degrading monooxygenase HmoA
MVARVWKGVTRPGDADKYLTHLKNRIFPEMRNLEGHADAWVLRRPVGDGMEFIVMTLWQSREAIRAFAGEDIGVAVVPPDAQALLASWDPHATHYDVV